MNITQIYNCFLECKSVTTDTRKITKNSMFFSLKGENFNGNTFAFKAIEQGSKYAIVDEKEYAINDNIILVDDVLKTLQELATYHRTKLGIPIIALTGSNGKTTTKELINAVLSQQYNTTATLGNLNNHIGVPLTLLSMNNQTEIGIVEMGANHPKEIAFLSSIALPDYGLITNFGKAHLEGFGSIEGVVKAKSELYDHLKQHNKTIFVNEDDVKQVNQIGSYTNTIKFGTTSDILKIEFIGAQPNVEVKLKDTIIASNLTGKYNFSNIAYAIAIGTYFKIENKNIKKAIENYFPKNNRSQVINVGSNEIILDAYNANPTSMMAALENFLQYKRDNKVLFLGDMFELGSTANNEHQNIVNFIEDNFNANTYLIGENFYSTQLKNTDGFIQKFRNFNDLATHFDTLTFKDKLMLIKGSRGMALERILDLIK
ncbi:UDP-N-acetylmuramoyl-tripeptide--D-alanyl-D-alanine ligase [Meridianimaribacter flavus]|uniref:UDP-N-acetylmuramoyl-tripeptide--D-alanyl-D- alanine ligase n=1 Tax=Gaetbulibacter sp. NE TaxID=2982307 RepID=UPI0021CE7AED|nr:UDP-N-acetylmuramoyl-tripeptide--D-alanyl-D-alanine ligase [Gaetbulibacter sp. NE]